ncbi:MAG: glycosyl hydrolase [Rikenellaceae bacterium]
MGFKTTEEYLESYPGDDYVDVFGLDSYTKANMESNYTEQSALLVSQLNIISNLAQQRGKVAALTEFGHDLLDDTKTLDEVYTKFYLDILQRIDGNIAYMMTWYNSSEKHFTPLSEDVSYINDFTRFVQSDEVLTHEEVGSLFL